MVPNTCIYIISLIYLNTRSIESDLPQYSVKQTGFSVPIVHERYNIHSIVQMLVDHFHKIVCYCWWIQRLGIIQTLVLVLLANIQQGRDLCNAYQKYTGSP